MKVFISWSGALSRALAIELHEWLPMVVQQVDAWISKRDIDPGQRWALALSGELAQSNFAIICLTAENRQSPWILFEAGAVARSVDARVVPLLFGITPGELDGPLAQFQSVQADESGMRSLVSSLYETSQSGLDYRRQAKVFAQLWPLFEERLRALTSQVGQTSEIESPIDLVAGLASANWVDVPTEKANVIDRLERERRRLRQELEYLNAEEEKLTQQDAPISLVDRAIEPTEHRLAQVESTLESTLDRTFETLSPSQIALLRGFVSSRGVQLIRSAEDIPANVSSDLKALLQTGLVAIDEGDVIVVHDLIGGYFSKKYTSG